MAAERTTNLKHYALYVMEEYFRKKFPEDATTYIDAFIDKYEELLAPLPPDHDEVTGVRQLMAAFKPALETVLLPGPEKDELLDIMVVVFNAVWEGANRRVHQPLTEPHGPAIPGTDPPVELKYYCAVCKEYFEVSEDEKTELLTSSEQLPLPQHHGKEMHLVISYPNQPEVAESTVEDEDIEPVELVMGHLRSENPDYMKLLSVGIDIGSSTSHLIFSMLTLKRETGFLNLSGRFNVVSRKVIYKSDIIFTPLLDRETIDLEAILEFCDTQYQKAGITREMVNTGAVVVTGETAKKQNAEDIVQHLSSQSGKFVQAAAGPNLESLLSAMGSGIVEQTKQEQTTILTIDIGGGTSNLAVASKGDVLSTSCINVGGRLLGINDAFKIWRIDGPTQFLFNELGMDYQIGDIMTEADVQIIAKTYAQTLYEVIQGPATSRISKELMMTDDLELPKHLDGIAFSGGVAELIYDPKHQTYDDIGAYLAKEISTLIKQSDIPLIEPPHKIRATVIGAGAFSLSVSGATTYFDSQIPFPLANIPVIPVTISTRHFTPDIVANAITKALTTFDIQEGRDPMALYFANEFPRTYDFLTRFAHGLTQALPNTVAEKKTIILLFASDVGQMMGVAIRKETAIQNNLLCLDELSLQLGDWIDIGGPLKQTRVFPVNVKSLVFYQPKEYHK